MRAASVRAVTAPRRDSVQSLDRAFDLLEALAGGQELGVTELAHRTELVPSTVHRLLATLAKRGYVAQSADSGRYRLGYKVAEIAGGLEQGLAQLRAVARPHLERISEQTGETVNLVVLDGDRVVYVDQVEGTRRVRMFTAVGTAALAHTTGSGKAIMAFGPPEAPAALYGDRELERLTNRTLTTLAALEDDEVDGLPGGPLDPLQVWARDRTQALAPVLEPAGDLDDLVAEQVAAGLRALADVAALGQRVQQPVRRAGHQAGPVGQLGHAELAP